MEQDKIGLVDRISIKKCYLKGSIIRTPFHRKLQLVLPHEKRVIGIPPCFGRVYFRIAFKIRLFPCIS